MLVARPFIALIIVTSLDDIVKLMNMLFGVEVLVPVVRVYAISPVLESAMVSSVKTGF